MEYKKLAMREKKRIALVAHDNKKTDLLEMIRYIICIFIAGMILSVSPLMAGDEKKESAAVTSAESWLSLVDKGNYADSWNEAAGYFRNAIPKEQWVQSLNAARKPFGSLVSRKLKTKEYKTSLPGAPDGEYVVIQFDTSFQNKKTAIETVTPMKDKDGKWRVSGYYIK